MNPVSARLLSQQLVAPLFSKPEEVVAYFGAMQAQEYRLMRWAVAMRTKRPSLEAFRDAFDAGRIVRLHLLRGTWQLVSKDDYWWMLELCAPKAIAVTRGWMTSNKIAIPQEELLKIREILCQTASDMRSVTKEDFELALLEKGLAMDEHRLSYHIRMAEFAGVLCSGDLLPMKATYSLSEQKIPQTGRLDRDEALALLTRKYFQSHAPATLEDFVWWSGLSSSDCRKGISLLKDELEMVNWKGYGFYVHESCRIRGFRKGNALLIPSYDEYLIGYKSREVVLPAMHRHRAHNNSGIFYPVFACDGLISGNWKPFAKEFQAEFFDSDEESEALQREWLEYQHYLSC